MKRNVLLRLLHSLLILAIPALLILAWAYLRFGGVGTGPAADKAEVAAHAKAVEEIKLPEEAQIIALGEASHGCLEFQELKLELFSSLVDQGRLKAFALEGDAAGCAAADRYIHGGPGTAKQALEAIGFRVYQTAQMEALLGYMRQYNATAAEGEDLRLYGFDMQRPAKSLEMLEESCQRLELDFDISSISLVPSDLADLEKLKTELEALGAGPWDLRWVELLENYIKISTAPDQEQGSKLRDSYMAQQLLWILEQEQQRGQKAVFAAAHNSHAAKFSSYDSMGSLLDKDLGSGYYAIGTDFYSASCDLPGKDGKRIERLIYSRDPVAKAVKQLGLERCWLDFSEIPESSPLWEQLHDYCFMGSIGDIWWPLMRLIPQSYRSFQPPAVLYDSMIFVTRPQPSGVM